MDNDRNYYLDKESAQIALRILGSAEIKALAKKTGEIQSVLVLIIKGKRKASKYTIDMVVERTREKIEELKMILKP